MSDSERHFPYVRPRTDGHAALERYCRAHEGYESRLVQVEKLGAQALVSGAVVLGVDPVTLGFGLRDGQLATALTAREPLVSAEIAERRLEIAVACVAGWAEELARTVRKQGDRHASQLDRLAEDIRQESGRMQHLLYREGMVRHTRPFCLAPDASVESAPIPLGQGEIPDEDGDLTLRERIVALMLKLERSQAGGAERDCIIERLKDERLRMRMRIQELEQERDELKSAVSGWRREARERRTRRARREFEQEGPPDGEEDHSDSLDHFNGSPAEGYLAETLEGPTRAQDIDRSPGAAGLEVPSS